MKHYLTRYGSTPFGTFGEMILGDERIYTVERPWLDNKPFTSCIPDDEYELIHHSTNKHPNSLALVNADIGVTHYKETHSTRYGILIHTGNTMEDVVGCIAPGKELGTLLHDWAVLHSRGAMQLVNKHINPGDSLIIEWQRY